MDNLGAKEMKDMEDEFGGDDVDSDAGLGLLEESSDIDLGSDDEEKSEEEGEKSEEEEVVKQPKEKDAVRMIGSGENRRTLPVMTEFERAKLIGERATQLEQGYTDIDPRIVAAAKSLGLTDMLYWAELELETITVPFPINVIRPISARACEVWNARELKLPSRVNCESYSPEATALLHSIRSDLRTTCMSFASMTPTREFALYKMGRAPV